MSTGQDRDQRGGLGLHRIKKNCPDPEMEVFRVACQLWERTTEGGRSMYLEEMDNTWVAEVSEVELPDLLISASPILD
jgi:hypothetical protein